MDNQCQQTTIMKALQNHCIHYKWGFPTKLLIMHQGKTHVVRTLSSGLQLLPSCYLQCQRPLLSLKWRTTGPSRISDKPCSSCNPWPAIMLGQSRLPFLLKALPLLHWPWVYWTSLEDSPLWNLLEVTLHIETVLLTGSFFMHSTPVLASALNLCFCYFSPVYTTGTQQFLFAVHNQWLILVHISLATLFHLSVTKGLH